MAFSPEDRMEQAAIPQMKLFENVALNNFKSSNFEIRFHLMPSTKVTKTQDNKSILIELEKEGWKLSLIHI